MAGATPPRFARDPAAAPDGSIYIAVMTGNKIARFDPKTKTFKEWDMPSGHRPHGVLVDKSRHRVEHRQRQRHHRPARSGDRQDHRIPDAVRRRRPAYADHHR